jgi:ABC-type transport system involved in multi-copper enzyme maturation permease subunit
LTKLKVNKMVSTIIKKEILENLLTLKFTLFTLFCVILIPLSLYFNYKSYQTRLDDYRETVRLQQEKIKTVYIRDYSEKMKGFRAPSSLMIFARGLEDVLPQWATATKTGPAYGHSNLSQESIQVFIENVDFHFIIKFIFSLMALLFAFNLICGEKEKGTLRQSLANAVPRHRLLIGKILGSYFVFIIPFILSLIIGLLMLSFLAPELLTGNNLLRIILILLISLLYVSVFFMLGLWISSRTKNTITSLVTLLFLWILIVFIIPGISQILAKIVHPIKTEQVLNLEKELAQKQINKEKAEALKDIYFEFSGGVAHYSGDKSFEERFEKYTNARKPIAMQFEKQERNELAQLDRDYLQNQHNQEKLTIFFSALSVAPVFSYAITNMTNTGLTVKHDFYSSAINFNILMNDQVYSKIWRDEFVFGESGSASQGGYYEVPPKEVSSFSFNPPKFSEALSQSWVNILLLVIYNVLFFVGGYVSFLRYDVR